MAFCVAVAAAETATDALKSLAEPASTETAPQTAAPKPEPAPRVRLFDTFYPFYETRKSFSSSDVYVRPFYSRRVDTFNQIVEWDFLWPFFFGTERPDLHRVMIAPLFVHDSEKPADGGEVKRTALLPLYYHRTITDKAGEKQPGDFFVVPFGGVFHNFLGRDRVLIILWPLYIKQQGPEVTTWSVIHPIFKFIRWKDGGSGWKVWPLFGINNHTGKMRSLFVLWPIFTKQWGTSPQGEYRTFSLWPFYGSMDNPGGWERNSIWPFFGIRYEKQFNEKSYWYPWPFLGHRTGPERGGFTIWPLFSTECGPDRRESYFLWPFGWYRHERPKGEDKVSFQLVPLTFFGHERTANGEDGGWQIWPLVKRRWYANGGSDFETLSLWPMRNFGPWERNFAPLFRIFEYSNDGFGERKWGALWRLIRVERSPVRRYTAFRPFYSSHSEPPESKRGWKVLGGLLGREGDAKDVQWRVLYFIKWHRISRQQDSAAK